MHIELIGCTGAGKSTLVRQLIEGCRARGVAVVTGHDLVLRTVGLHWIRPRLIRALLIDVVAGLACLLAWPTHAPFFRFALRTIAALPGSRLRRLNTARNVFKNVGIWEIARRGSAGRRVVVVDEGTLHTAHYLFAHVSADVNRPGIETFARLVPLPDVAVYVQQDEDVLVDRTLERGHRRIPDPSPAHVRLFIGHAVQTFQLLAQQPAVQGRWLVLSPGKDGVRWSSG